jgi:broad specificity phosphatase PhoE
MITIYFEPHSISLDNESGLASGWDDVDLSEEGIKRLNEQWPDRYKDRKIDAIFCSDMQRTYKCAVVISKDKNIPIYIDTRLRECNYGDFTGKDKKLINSEKVNRIDISFPNGESYKQCINRMKEFLEYLKLNYSDKTVLIIGHRATQYGLENYINHKDIKECITEPWEYQPGWTYYL